MPGPNKRYSKKILVPITEEMSTRLTTARQLTSCESNAAAARKAMEIGLNMIIGGKTDERPTTSNTPADTGS